jgi:hypothetical protein
MSVAAWIGLALAYLVVGFVLAVMLSYHMEEDSIGFLGATVLAWPAMLLIIGLGEVGAIAGRCAEKLRAAASRRRDWQQTLGWRAEHPNWEADVKAEQALRAIAAKEFGGSP